MFGLSILEITVILLVALLVFGPEKLPEIATKLGELFGTLQKNIDEASSKIKLPEDKNGR